jgi:hypothetical protein
MIVSFLLGSDQPPYRLIAEADLPAAPLVGENISITGRVYTVAERSWRLGTAPSELGPDHPAMIQIGVGVLLQQIAGPPHVAIAREMPEKLQ